MGDGENLPEDYKKVNSLGDSKAKNKYGMSMLGSTARLLKPSHWKLSFAQENSTGPQVQRYIK